MSAPQNDERLNSPPRHEGHLPAVAAEVLSAEGVFQASEEARKLLCLLSDNRLLVANGQAMNPHVQSYCARLERMCRSFDIVFTSIEEIAAAYRSKSFNAGQRNLEATTMQITARDLLAKACQSRASDIHIRVKKQSTEFYFRIHNDLIKIGVQTREHGERLLATIYSAMTTVSDNAYRPTERQDAAIGDGSHLPDPLYGVRIATAPTAEGTVMVLRLLYDDAGDNLDLGRLGFSKAQVQAFQQLKEQPIGINLISGPTGSGKSTTLQRVLSGEIVESDGRIHLLTVEDPVEYPINGAVQTAVTNAGTEAERSRQFAAAIANAMRLDPDTLMIGEIRDGASAQSALRAAMTGHQVWSTVHANNAIAIVDRLVDLGLPLGLVADHTILTGLISQRLLKVLCPHCKKNLLQHRQEVTESIFARVWNVMGANIDQVCIAGNGCEHCRGTGASGRTVVAEVIIPDARFFDYLRAGDKMQAHSYWINELGGQTLLTHAIEKVAAGNVDPRAAERTVGYLIADTGMTSRKTSLREAYRAS